MIPFQGVNFFCLAFVLLIPAFLFGYFEKSLKYYGMVINLIFLYFIFKGNKYQIICVILFYVGELILINTYIKIRKKYKCRLFLWICIVFSLLPLVLTKFSNIILHIELGKIGFLGISYITFKCIQVLIEIYDGLIKEISLLDFTYFLFFFPTISAGPIDRSRRFEDDINKIWTRKQYLDLFKTGLYKMFTGIFYKFGIGLIISKYWIDRIPTTHNFINSINYMYSYSFYLFFDFAGYSLMAIGLSYIMGIRTVENFNLPFISKNIKDFWNRWHMSLSFWFRDFIYTRFVMTSMKKKWFKSRYTSSYIGYLITMLTMGIWHGTEKFYILYGLYHGILIIVTDFYERKSKFHKKYKNKPLYEVLQVILTFNFVCFGFLIFSGYLFIK